MQIKKLKLTNAFQHASLDVDFQPFQAIVGANGSGKSNIIEALGFALTGAFTLPGKQESMIKEGEDNGKIEAVIESEGELISLSSKLGKSSRSLVRGKLKIGKAPEVLEYLERQVLRTPFNIVNESSIIRQGKLDEGLFSTQAKRTDTFLRMAGLSDIEKKRQALSDAKAMITVPMLSFTVAETEAKLQELKDYLKRLREEQAAVPVVDEGWINNCKTAVAMKQKTDAAILALKEAVPQLTKDEQLEKDAEALAADMQARLDALTVTEEQTRTAADTARVALAGIEQAKRSWTRKQELLDQATKALDAMDALRAPPEQYQGDDPDTLMSLFTEINTKVSGLNETLNAFKQPLAACPTCRRPCTVQEARDILAAAQHELDELISMQNEVKLAVTKAKADKNAWGAAVSVFEQQTYRLETQMKSLGQQLAELDGVTAPASGAQYTRMVNDYEAVRKQLTWSRTKLTEALDLLSATRTRKQAIAVRVDELRKQAVSDSTDVLYDTAIKAVKEYDSCQSKLAELRGLVQGAEKQVQDEQVRLDKLKKQTEDAKTLSAYAEHLEFARTALHRDNFPSGKVKAFVDRMLINANMYLDCMQAGFSVSYDKDEGFIAFFPKDDKHMRADRLSGGEKVTFALAFRFAVNDLHTDTGFLILDEPTVWLDDKHIDYVIGALALVKSKLVPRVQLIIVTHDEKLAAVADSVFEVVKP